MANVEINIGLQVTKQTPINKGDFEQLIFALGETEFSSQTYSDGLCHAQLKFQLLQWLT